MRWSFRLFTWQGIAVKVHVTFLLLLGFFALLFYKQGGPWAAVEGCLFILLLFLCVLLHEFGHALAAKAYGIRTPDITLLPIGGVARLERMPDKPYQELVVALAGPLVNVVIACALLLVMGGRGDFRDLTQIESRDVDLIMRLFSVNLMLALFNMLPAFPMDGGRVLRALLATRMNYARATHIAASVGQGMAFLLGFAGLFYNPMLILIAVFIYLGASQEASVAQMKDVTTGLPVSSAMITRFSSLPDSADINRAIDLLLAGSQHDFPVTDAGGAVVGVLTREQMLRALRQRGGETPVRDVMQRDIPAVHANANFDEAFRAMQECACPALPVLDSAGRLVGLITPENVGEMMMIHAALAGRGTPSWRKGVGV